jgi:predicted MPP superfamily phosphohydrolase
VILAGLFASLYSFFIEPALRLRVRKWKIKRDDWPAETPLGIVAISDLHVGEPNVGLRRVRQIVKRAIA